DPGGSSGSSTSTCRGRGASRTASPRCSPSTTGRSARSSRPPASCATDGDQVSETSSYPAEGVPPIGPEPGGARPASYGAAVAREQARQRTPIRLALESYVYPTVTFVLLIVA